MTNINCSNDCIYQKDGKCRLDTITAMNITSSGGCAYCAKPDTFISKQNPMR